VGRLNIAQTGDELKRITLKITQSDSQYFYVIKDPDDDDHRLRIRGIGVDGLDNILAMVRREFVGEETPKETNW